VHSVRIFPFIQNMSGVVTATTTWESSEQQGVQLRTAECMRTLVVLLFVVVAVKVLIVRLRTKGHGV
jgi:hypothetical protein